MIPVQALPRSWVLGALVLAGGLTGLVAPTGSAPAVAAVPSAAPVSDQRAVDLLRTAYEAGRQLRYEGFAFVGVTGTFLRVHLRHVPGTGTYVSAAGSGPDADDPGGTGATLQPDGRAAGPDPLAMLARHYQLAFAGLDRMAGRPAYVVRALRPGSAPTVAAAFWIDQRTHLVLARSAFDDDGDEYEQVMFTSIEVDDPPRAQSTLQGGDPLAGDGPAGEAPAPGQAALERLRAAGWHVDRSLAGGFQLYDARVVSGGRSPMLHLSYSDGLATLSLFEQRGRLVSRALAGWRRAVLAGRTVYVDASSPQRLAWQGGGTVFALLSDAAPARVAGAVGGLPHGGAGDGVADRMARGFDRLGSWLDPFG
ncbi:MAG: sigma-E factor regulatory protein RseB domain-containing protein [Frankiaceae bacterium]